MSQPPSPAPMQAPELQLRVHTGVHAGALETLTQDLYLIGTAPDCDLVLGDAGLTPHHAELRQTQATWTLKMLGDGTYPAADAAAMEVGILYALGRVVLSINHHDASWPTPQELRLLASVPVAAASTTVTTSAPSAPTSRADKPTVDSDTVTDTGADPRLDLIEATESEEASPVPEPRVETTEQAAILPPVPLAGTNAGNLRPKSTMLLGSLVAGVLITAAWVLWPTAGHGVDVAAQAPAQRAASAQNSMTTVEQVVASLALGPRVTVEPRPWRAAVGAGIADQ